MKQHCLNQLERTNTFLYFRSLLLSVFLVLTFNISSLYAQQYTLTDNDVVVENGIIKNCSYNFELKNIIIPNILDVQTVIGIANSTFSNKGIISIKLPETIKTIGDYAFERNNITSTDLSSCKSLIYIGNGAFNGNFSLTGFTLPEVTYKGSVYKTWNDGAGKSFTAGVDRPSDFSTFFSINIPYTLTNDDVVVENGIIKSCSYNFEFKNIIIPDILDGQTVIGIAKGETPSSGVFYYKRIFSIKLPVEIKTIGDYAFYWNNITNLDLSGCKSLIYIGNYVFASNLYLKGIVLPEVTYKGTVYKTWNDGKGKSFTAGVYQPSDFSTLFSINIPYTLTDDDVVVDKGIIKSCSYNFELKNIIIPNVLDVQTVIGIANSTFSNKGIISIKLPETIKTIGDYAFERNNITSMDLSACNSLTYIGTIAFYGNFSLKGFTLPEVTYKGSVYKTWSDGTGKSFTAGVDQPSDFSTFFSINIPYTLTDDDVVVENGIIKSCSYNFELKNIIIPNTLDAQMVIGITNSTFSNKGIISIKLPETIKTIGDYAFDSNNITSLDLSICKSLIYIGTAAFSSNYSLKEFVLPEVTFNGMAYKIWNDGKGKSYSAGVDQPSDFYTIFTINIPYTLTNDDVVVENGIIKSCSYNFEFKNIIIPNILDGQTVTGIAKGEFYNSGLFYNKHIFSIKLPVAIKIIGDYAFYANNITSLDLSDCKSLIYIGNQAFASNSYLKGFVLPEVTFKGSVYKTWNDGKGKSYTVGVDQLSDFNTDYIANIPYTLTDDDVVVENGFINSCSYNFELKNIIIPNALDGQPVTGIAKGESFNNGLFYNKRIFSIRLPETIKTIGDYAFNSNNINILDLTNCNSLTYIGKEAFSGNPMKGFTLPEVTYKGTVYKIWNDGTGKSFAAGVDQPSYFYTLFSIYIPYTLTDDDVVVDKGVIISCSYNFELKNIIIPNTLDAQTVIGIANSTFSNKGILSIKLPEAIETIGASAFYSNNIFNLDLSGCTALKTIGSSAFGENKITNLDFSACTILKSIENGAFNRNSLLTLNLTKCKNLIYIGSNAFYDGNYKLKPFTLPEVIYKGQVYKTWIDGNWKSYTAGVDPVTDVLTYYLPLISYTLTDEDVVVENGILKSGSYNFEFKNIVIPETLDGQKVVGIPNNSTLFWGKGITSIKLPATIESIGDGAFSSNNIKSVDLSDKKNLFYIGTSAFAANSLLKGINMPETLIPGYFYSFWFDSSGKKISAGELVSNLYTNYTKVMPEIKELKTFSANISGNKEVILTGRNFETQKNGKRILFSGKESLSYVFWSDTLIRVVCPPNPEGYSKIEMILENSLICLSPKSLYYSPVDLIEVCGNVSGTWEKGKSYLLTCKQVKIDVGKSLIIEEGVKVIANSYSIPELICNEGKLEVRGTKNNPVIFTATIKEPGSWGGIILENTENKCSLNNCIVEYATTAIYLKAYNYGCSTGSNNTKIENCIVRNNSSTGILSRAYGVSPGCTVPKVGEAEPTIVNCEIYGNGEYGIYCYSSMWTGGFGSNSSKIYNNLIYNNKYGVICTGNSDMNPKIVNNSILNNKEAGIYSSSSLMNTFSDKYIISNNIFAYNKTGFQNTTDSVVVLNNNCLWGNAQDYNGKITKKSNIELDPLFISLNNFNFQLQLNSPCIDAGTNMFVTTDKDIAGKSRIFNATGKNIPIVDIGAYEHNGTISNSRIIQDLDFHYSIFPNPTNGPFVFRLDSQPKSDLILKLINPLGQMIETRKVKQSLESYTEQFDLNKLSKGIYMLIVFDGKSSVAKKIVVK